MSSWIADTYKQTPRPSQIFISAWDKTSVTISGPPARLKRLFRVSKFFTGQKCINLPVFSGLCHANHVYTAQHVKEIIHSRGDSPQYLNANFPGPPIHALFSTSTGKPFDAKTAEELLEQVVAELLTQPITFDNVIEGFVDHVAACSPSECQILTFRNSLPVHDFLAGLNAAQETLGKVELSTEELIPALLAKKASVGPPRSPRQSKIAIVGMSCRLPGGSTNTEKFWQLLEQGLDVYQKVPADRFDVETHCDPTGKRMNTGRTPYGCFVDNPGFFDAPFFNMSPREAEQVDPMQRLALVTAYEALERAGYVANRTASTHPSRIGTFYGQAR